MVMSELRLTNNKEVQIVCLEEQQICFFIV